jgi:hypothetical protein
MLGPGSLLNKYPILDCHDGVMYINFGVGLYDNKDNVWKKFGD